MKGKKTLELETNTHKQPNCIWNYEMNHYRKIIVVKLYTIEIE